MLLATTCDRAPCLQMAKELPKDQIVLVNLCGRGDKDMHTVAKHLGEDV